MLIMHQFAFVMNYFYNAEMLLGYDAAFLLDDEANLTNMIGCCFFEPFEFEQMKDHVF